MGDVNKEVDTSVARQMYCTDEKEASRSSKSRRLLAKIEMTLTLSGK